MHCYLDLKETEVRKEDFIRESKELCHVSVKVIELYSHTSKHPDDYHTLTHVIVDLYCLWLSCDPRVHFNQPITIPFMRTLLPWS